MQSTAYFLTWALESWLVSSSQNCEAFALIFPPVCIVSTGISGAGQDNHCSVHQGGACDKELICRRPACRIAMRTVLGLHRICPSRWLQERLLSCLGELGIGSWPVPRTGAQGSVCEEVAVLGGCRDKEGSGKHRTLASCGTGMCRGQLKGFPAHSGVLPTHQYSHGTGAVNSSHWGQWLEDRVWGVRRNSTLGEVLMQKLLSMFILISQSAE